MPDPMRGEEKSREQLVEHLEELRRQVAKLERLEAEHQQTEEALRESEERYRRMIETASEGIWVIDANHETTFVNARMANMLGHTVDEMVGISLLSFMDDEGRTIAEASLARRRQGFVERRDFKFVCKDGTALWAIVSTTPIFDRWGRYAGALCMLTDVTERRRVQEEVATSFSLLRATLDSTADGILVVNTDGRMVSFNLKFVAMWRIPQDIVDSRDDTRALAFVLDQLTDPEAFLKKVKELYSQPESESFDILRFKDGRVFERYSQPQRVGRKSVGRVWSFRDVTPRVQTEEELRREKTRLEQLNSVLLGREERVLDLKQEINALLEELGRPQKYRL